MTKSESTALGATLVLMGAKAQLIKDPDVKSFLFEDYPISIRIEKTIGYNQDNYAVILRQFGTQFMDQANKENFYSSKSLLEKLTDILEYKIK